MLNKRMTHKSVSLLFVDKPLKKALEFMFCVCYCGGNDWVVKAQKNLFSSTTPSQQACEERKLERIEV